MVIRRTEPVERGVPSAAELRARRWMVLFPLVFLSLPLVMIFVVRTQSGFLAIVPSLALGLGCAAYSAVLRRRDQRELERAGYRVCLRCRYSLATLPDAGVCPECGAAYEHGNLKTVWARTYEPDDT